MPAKLKPEFVYAALKSKGISHLSPYLYATEKMDLECDACGHDWKSTYDNIKQGRSCPSCSKKLAVAKIAASKRLPLAEINKRLQPYEVTVGMGYQNTKLKTTLSCLRCGHEWDGIVNLIFQRNAKTYLCPTERLQKMGFDVKKKSRKSSRKTQLGSNQRTMVAVPSEFKGQFGTYEECVYFLIQDLRSRLEQNGGTGYYDQGHVSITTTLFSYLCPKGHSDKRSLMDAYTLNHLCSKCGAEFETSPRAKRKSWPSRKPFFSDLTVSEDYLALLEESNIKFLGIEQTESGQTLAKTICKTCRQLYTKSIKRLNSREASPLCSCSDPQMNESFGSRLLAKVKDRGGNLLTEVVKNADDHYLIQCAEEHDSWPVQGGSVVYLDSWCPKCAGNLARDLDELRLIIQSRGGALLSTVNKGVDGSYDYTCSLGHPNTNLWRKIERGQWCNTCGRSSKSEEITRHVLQEIFDRPFPKKRPRWLRNSRDRQMELDGYAEDLAVAFEYQGEQHFKESSWYGGNLQQRIGDDKRKAKLCLQHGVCLLIATYEDDYSDFAKIFEAQLNERGFDTKGYDFEAEIDLSGAFIRDDRIDELREALAKKNLELISDKFIKVDTFYDIRCQKCAHQFQAPANRYLSPGREPAGCNKCNRSAETALERYGLEIEELQDYASARGGRLLSSAYRGSKKDHWWDCGVEEHLHFQARFSNMKHRNNFCPFCDNRKKRNVQVYELGTLLWRMNREPLETLSKRSTSVNTLCLECEVEAQIIIAEFQSEPSPCCSL